MGVMRPVGEVGDAGRVEFRRRGVENPAVRVHECEGIVEGVHVAHFCPGLGEWWGWDGQGKGRWWGKETEGGRGRWWGKQREGVKVRVVEEGKGEGGVRVRGRGKGRSKGGGERGAEREG